MTPAFCCSYRGADAHLRTTEISSSGFLLAEEQSADAELGHITESINWHWILLLEVWMGLLLADITAPTISGVSSSTANGSYKAGEITINVGFQKLSLLILLMGHQL